MKKKEKCCRVCLTIAQPKNNLSSLYKVGKNGDKAVNLLNYLMGTEIHQYDKLPQTICSRCLIKLKRAADFKTDFLKNDLELRTLYAIPANKEEVQSFDDIKDNLPLVKCEAFEIADPFTVENDECIQDSIKIEEEKFQSEFQFDDNDNNSDSYLSDVISPVRSKLVEPKQTLIETGMQKKNRDKVKRQLGRITRASQKINSNYIADEDFLNEENDPEKLTPEYILEEHNKNAHTTFGMAKCVLKFDDFDDHTIHMKNYHSYSGKRLGYHKCFICKKNFDSRCARDFHLDNCHTNDTNCTSCDHVAKDSRKLCQHIKLIHTKKIYKKKTKKEAASICDQCGQEFNSRLRLKIHLVKIHKTELFKIKCSECPERFFDNKYLSYHFDKTHRGGYRCDLCGKKVPIKPRLLLHFKRWHGLKAEYQCLLCKSVFCSATGSKKHKAKYPNGECLKQFRNKSGIIYIRPTFPCPHCPKVFKYDNAHFDGHKNAHLKLKPYICDKCQIGFGNRSTLKNHRLSCLNLKEFKCGYCEETFNRHTNRLTHEAMKHTGIASHFCKFCDAKFFSVNRRSKHQKAKHPDQIHKQKKN